MSLFEARVIGLGPVEQLVVRLASPTRSRQGLLRELGVLIQKQHTQRVMSEKTSPDGVAWAPLTESTLKKKKAGSILVATGTMAKAWSLNFGANNVRMRNTTDYLQFHQFGSCKMAARVVMGFSEANKAEITQLLNRSRRPSRTSKTSSLIPESSRSKSSSG